MKRTLKILLVCVAILIVTAAALLYPKFRNMPSEYSTAQAIGELEEYVQQHSGSWPRAASDLGDRYPVGGEVFIDYTMTADRLMESPEQIRQAVRPRSGRFYTYPHYDERIEDLYEVLRATNQKKRTEPSTEAKPQSASKGDVR